MAGQDMETVAGFAWAAVVEIDGAPVLVCVEREGEDVASVAIRIDAEHSLDQAAAAAREYFATRAFV